MQILLIDDRIPDPQFGAGFPRAYRCLLSLYQLGHTIHFFPTTKGSVQEVENLPDGSEVKITIAHWYTPDGVNINKKGLTPDTVISNNGAATGTDPQLDKANALVQAQIGS